MNNYLCGLLLILTVSCGYTQQDPLAEAMSFFEKQYSNLKIPGLVLSYEQALGEWKKYIEHKDDIGLREINRMRRWPAQVLSYKMGAKAIQEARLVAKKNQGATFGLKKFHTKILSRSSIPVRLIGELFG